MGTVQICHFVTLIYQNWTLWYSALLLLHYLCKDIQVSMLAVLSESWSHSSLWSEGAQMQWLDSCCCKTVQSKGEAITFYCAQRPLGGNGQDLKRKGYSNLWIWSNNKQVHIPEIAKIPRQVMTTVQINKRCSISRHSAIPVLLFKCMCIFSFQTEVPHRRYKGWVAIQLYAFCLTAVNLTGLENL